MVACFLARAEIACQHAPKTSKNSPRPSPQSFEFYETAPRHEQPQGMGAKGKGKRGSAWGSGGREARCGPPEIGGSHSSAQSLASVCAKHALHVPNICLALATAVGSAELGSLLAGDWHGQVGRLNLGEKEQQHG